MFGLLLKITKIYKCIDDDNVIYGNVMGVQNLNS